MKSSQPPGKKQDKGLYMFEFGSDEARAEFHDAMKAMDTSAAQFFRRAAREAVAEYRAASQVTA